MVPEASDFLCCKIWHPTVQAALDSLQCLTSPPHGVRRRNIVALRSPKTIHPIFINATKLIPSISQRNRTLLEADNNKRFVHDGPVELASHQRGRRHRGHRRRGHDHDDQATNVVTRSTSKNAT
jgi:hypothetical protein